MQGNILSGYPEILPLQVKVSSDVTSVSAFHVQGNVQSDVLAILPLSTITL